MNTTEPVTSEEIVLIQEKELLARIYTGDPNNLIEAMRGDLTVARLVMQIVDTSRAYNQEFIDKCGLLYSSFGLREIRSMSRQLKIALIKYVEHMV